MALDLAAAFRTSGRFEVRLSRTGETGPRYAERLRDAFARAIMAALADLLGGATPEGTGIVGGG